MVTDAGICSRIIVKYWRSRSGWGEMPRALKSVRELMARWTCIGTYQVRIGPRLSQ